MIPDLALRFLAASNDAPLPPEVDLILKLMQIPLAGLILIGLFRGWLVTGREHDRVINERDAERVERIEAQAGLLEVVPLLSSVQRTLERNDRMLDDVYAPVRPPRRGKAT